MQISQKKKINRITFKCLGKKLMKNNSKFNIKSLQMKINKEKITFEESIKLKTL